MKIFFLSIFIFNSVVYGLGISTDFNNIFIENLQIAQEYNLTKLFNLPFKAKNSSDKKVKIKIESKIPTATKPGFEPIPTSDWIKILNSEILVGPQEFAVSDLVLKIPNDTNLLGKKFQANIWCYISSVEGSDGMFAITPGVEGSLFFSVSPETRKQKVKAIDLNFELEPKELFQKIKVGENFVGQVKVKNLSKKKYVFVVGEKNPYEVNLKPKEEGYSLLKENMLSFSPKKLIIKAGKEGKFDIYINNISAGKYFALAEVEVTTKDVTGSKYVKIYLEVDENKN